MNDSLSSTASSPRERVTLFLALLASDECRQACHQMLAPDRFAFVWCRLWFDAVYVPSTRYLDGLKGDRSDDAVAAFWSHFTDEEMEALERFHRFLELRVDMLRDDLVETESFPQTDAWDHVVRHAGYALEALEPDPEVLKQQVGWVAHVFTQHGETGEAPSSVVGSLHEAIGRERLTD